MGDEKPESRIYDELIKNCEDLLKQNVTNLQNYLELQESLRLQFVAMNHDYKRVKEWLDSAHEDFLATKHSDFTRLYELLVKHNLVAELVHFGRKQETLQLQFIEMMSGCVNLKDDLSTANKSVISLKREYNDLTVSNDALLENLLAKESFNLTRSLEILRMNFIEIIENSENSQDIIETAHNGLTKLKIEFDLLKQQYEELSGNEMVKGFIDYAKFQESLQLEIAEQAKEQKATLDRINQNLASLKTQLAETNEMLKTEQQRCQLIESERDSLDKSSDELCHLLLKYQQLILEKKKNRERSLSNETQKNYVMIDDSSLDDRFSEPESQLCSSDLSGRQLIIIDEEDLNVSPKALVIPSINGLGDSSNTYSNGNNSDSCNDDVPDFSPDTNVEQDSSLQRRNSDASERGKKLNKSATSLLKSEKSQDSYSDTCDRLISSPDEVPKEEPAKCTAPDLSESSKLLHEKHIRAETTSRFYCAHCDRRFFNKNELASHIQRRHIGELCKRFKCTTCGKSYSIERQLEHHKFTKHRHMKRGNLHGNISNRTNSNQANNRSKSYKCAESECDKTFTYRRNLKEHESTHSSKNLFKCSFCSKSFKHRFAKRLHAQKYHEKYARVQCAHCDKQYYSKQSIFIHLQKRHPSTLEKPIFKCSFCRKLFSSKAHLKEHKSLCYSKTQKGKENVSAVVVLNKFEVSSLCCGICNRLFSCLNTLNEHKRAEHNKLEPRDESSHASVNLNSSQSRFKCSYCDITFTTGPSTLLHERKFHDRVILFICSHCHKTFGWAPELKAHKERHFQLKRYECSVCDEVFSDRGLSKRHEIKYHNGVRHLVCGYCDQPRLLESDVPSHFRSNHPDRLAAPMRFKCSTCGKLFIHEFYLKEHQSVHSSEKPYKCSQCARCYKTTSALRKHNLYFHDRNFSFNCAHCSRGCSTRAQLITHIRNVHFNPRLSRFTQRNKTELKPTATTTMRQPQKQTPSAGSNCDNSLRSPFQKRFKCSQCDRVYSTPESRRRHVRIIHEEARAFICEHCNLSFSYKKDLMLHIFSDHRDTLSSEIPEMHKCNTCGKSFQCADNLKAHQLVHSSPKPFKCSYCDQCFENSSHRERHERVTHQGYSCFCTYCDEAFCKKDRLESHILTVHLKATLTYVAPTNAFKRRKRRSRLSVKNKTLEKPFKCSYCDNTYVRRDSCKKHERIDHDPNFVYICAHCNVSFSYKRALMLHINSDHPETRTVVRTKKHKCNTCGKLFPSPSNLKTHLSVHSSLKPYKCSDCDKCFKTTNLRRKHEREIHQGIFYPSSMKKFCAHCDKGYYHKDLLLAHIRRVHLQNIEEHERFKCSYCDKSFLDPTYKRTHERKIHERGDYSCTCAHCNKSFLYKKNLKTHIYRQHFYNPKKPSFKCNLCDKSYGYKYSLKAHMLTHAGSQKFKCSHCNTYFMHDTSRKHHERSIHGEFAHVSKFKCSRCNLYFRYDAGRKRHERSVHEGFARYTCAHCGKGFDSKNKLTSHMLKFHMS